MKSISEINQRLKDFNKKYKKSGLTDGKIAHKAAMASLKGTDTLKMSDEAKDEISKRLKGKPKTKSHIDKLKKTKLKYKISKEQILEAQIGTTTANEVANKLGIDSHTYKAVATYHNVFKKQSLSERNKLISSKPILCWVYGSEEFVGEYYSVSEAARQLNVAGTNIISVCKGKYKQCKGYYFEYKKG
jgi:hypothetical protein